MIIAVAALVAAAGIAVRAQRAHATVYDAPIVTGSAAFSHVRSFQADGTPADGGGFFAQPSSPAVGARVAVGDLSGKGVVDIVVAEGPNPDPRGVATTVRLFRGSNGMVGSFQPFEANSRSGATVAVADLAGFGSDAVIVGAGPGFPPWVEIYSWDDPNQRFIRRARFLAYDPNFLGGVNVAAGKLGLFTGPGPGGGPDVRRFGVSSDLQTVAFQSSFFAYDAGFAGGVRVALGEFDPPDGQEQLVTAPGPGGGPHVKIFNTASPQYPLHSFFAYDAGFAGGVYVGVRGVFQGTDQIVTGPGAGGGPNVRVFQSDGTVVSSFYAYDPAFKAGVYVAAGRGPYDKTPPPGTVTTTTTTSTTTNP